MIGKRPVITYYKPGYVTDLKPDDVAYHGKKAKHRRTSVIREIYVMEGSMTPSSEAIKGLYNPRHHILYDTFLLNNQFYVIVD